MSNQTPLLGVAHELGHVLFHPSARLRESASRRGALCEEEVGGGRGSVSDNGKRFDPARNDSGQGLVSMCKRAEKLNRRSSVNRYSTARISAMLRCK